MTYGLDNGDYLAKRKNMSRQDCEAEADASEIRYLNQRINSLQETIALLQEKLDRPSYAAPAMSRGGTELEARIKDLEQRVLELEQLTKWIAHFELAPKKPVRTNQSGGYISSSRFD